MATLEDKILGEKLHNYCSSSSEESDGEGNSTSGNDSKSSNIQSEEASASLPDPNKWEGTSTNTGPKGVIKDWQRYKQLEIEKRSEDENERIALMKKLTMTVQSTLDEERQKAANIDPEMAELLADDFLLNYQRQRMQEMIEQNQHNLKFGKLIYLRNGQEYLDAIDKEHKAVKIIIHIYEDNHKACRLMNEVLNNLCRTYVNVKFCAITSSKAGMSKEFKSNGIPALLIYKGGQVIGNFIRLTEDLGVDFDAEDVQAYLVELGMLEDKSLMPLLIKQNRSDSESE